MTRLGHLVYGVHDNGLHSPDALRLLAITGVFCVVVYGIVLWLGRR